MIIGIGSMVTLLSERVTGNGLGNLTKGVFAMAKFDTQNSPLEDGTEAQNQVQPEEQEV